MEKEKWKFDVHSVGLADTGDYDYYVTFTNGVDVLQSNGCQLEENELREFCNLLDEMPGLWSRELDVCLFENHQLKKQVARLNTALYEIKTGNQPCNEIEAFMFVEIAKEIASKAIDYK